MEGWGCPPYRPLPRLAMRHAVSPPGRRGHGRAAPARRQGAPQQRDRGHPSDAGAGSLVRHVP